MMTALAALNDYADESDQFMTATVDNAHLIVFGNEKGGSGKSTAAMHTAIALMRLGYKVGTLDLDARQGTLTRYLRNRWNTSANVKNIDLPTPFHLPIQKSRAKTVADQKLEESGQFYMALEELDKACDFVVVDTAGTDSFLGRLAHRSADTLVTPMNDSMIDLDLLADIDPQTHQINGPSIYTKMVKISMAEKRSMEGKDFRWIVMRNRLAHLYAKNKEEIQIILEKLSEEFDFTFIQGFGERVIYREMFLKGMTLLDLRANTTDKESLSMSEIAARQEVRNLIAAIAPQNYKKRKANNA